jgi:hypothetical protein
LLHHLDHLPEFKQLVYEEGKMPKLRTSLIEVMLDYFEVREEEDKRHNRPLLGSVKSINYHHHSLP